MAIRLKCGVWERNGIPCPYALFELVERTRRKETDEVPSEDRDHEFEIRAFAWDRVKKVNSATQAQEAAMMAMMLELAERYANEAIASPNRPQRIPVEVQKVFEDVANHSPAFGRRLALWIAAGALVTAAVLAGGPAAVAAATGAVVGAGAAGGAVAGVGPGVAGTGFLFKVPRFTDKGRRPYYGGSSGYGGDFAGILG